jgi:hypothetical protein
MQKHARLDAQSADTPGLRRKAKVSKIQSSSSALGSDIRRYAGIKHKNKT